MGGRKFRLSRHKNEERKRRLKKNKSMVVSIPRELVTITSFKLSFPISVYAEGTISSLESLSSRLASLPLPDSWIIAKSRPLTLCKSRVQLDSSSARADVSMSVGVTDQLQWSLSLTNKQLDPGLCPLLSGVPSTLTSATAVCSLLRLLNSTKICVGNPDTQFLDIWKQRSLTLHGSSGPTCAFIDDLSLQCGSTIRHVKCQLLLRDENQAVRCSECVTYRSTLTVQATRAQKQNSDATPSSHVNHRYQPLPTLISRLGQLQHQHRNLSKQLDRLKKKIAEASEVGGVSLDEQSHNDLKELANSSESSAFFDSLPKDSFQSIFWQQQVEAANKKDARSMRWHPLMIRWCLYLRHRSSGAYETLRSSGCVKLPSQRTLRDYTHYVTACTGFSSEVDEMLMKAAKVDSCPEREKCVILLLDEMHIREDLVFNKHNGAMIGFTNLGDVNDHLLRFEQSLSDGAPASPKLAKTMMVFMVRGLFSKLQFAYAQFPCADLSGDLLYEPFWEAVGRLENCGLQVLGATLDGNSVNRRLVKLHQPFADLVYKVMNPFAEKRFLYFFSDPPHLIKTVRNCWLSKHRNLWNDGRYISWSHLRSLYERDTHIGAGIRMVPKLKYEHISLTSFSKMRVDLAAQVLSESVSKALKLTGGNEASETARFVDMMDKFFDALNVHNYTEGVHKRKRFKMPYTSSKDMRLKWIESEFLPYLDKWEESVNAVPGLTKTQLNNRLLSAETRLGLRMTCKSFVELVQYIFTVPGVQSFLSQRICQDPLENFFGCQRQRGGVHDNPNVQEFIKNTQALSVINSFCKEPAKGNCRGSRNDSSLEKENAAEPLPKRPRRKSSTSKPLGLY